jgi:hypothetical protein
MKYWMNTLVTSFGLLIVFSPSLVRADAVDSDCTFQGKSLHGNVQFVDSFPDIKIQIVDSFPDLNVKKVDSFPDNCGEWKVVDSNGDLKVQIVDSFPDIKVKYVDSFPGLPSK